VRVLEGTTGSIRPIELRPALDQDFEYRRRLYFGELSWQAITQDDDLFVAQMVVDGPFQRKGIGTEVMKRLISEASEFNLAVRLNVVRINPVRRLYERLGFRVTHEDDRKFYMKRDPDVARRLSN
jgi:GNAT superfamily N-acetyltransferase